MHRTTARFIFVLVLAGTAAASALAQGSQRAPLGSPPTTFIFPVVGQTHYIDDFGAPRGQRGHEGTDIMGDWRAPLVAVESGRVKIWNTSARAGCMLYLYGKSGTTYLYIHLNNDLTSRGDDRGGCKPGVAYAPGLASGANVVAGQLLGFVGDSGDASGLHPHVHFELRPRGVGAISPFAHLRRAAQPLFALPLGQAKGRVSAVITLEGKVKAVRTLETGEQRLVLSVESVSLPGDDRRKVKRLVALSFADLAPPETGMRVRIVTQPVELNAPTQLAKPGVLGVGRLLVLSP